MGQYEKAEQFYLESKDITERTMGREHLSYAGSLNNLGYLYRDMGQYENSIGAGILMWKEAWQYS